MTRALTDQWSAFDRPWGRMLDKITTPRRDFLASTLVGAIAVPLASRGEAVAATQSAAEVHTVRRIKAGLLDVAYVDVGPPDGEPVLLLHGWPYDIHCYTEASQLLANAGYRVIIPYLRGFGATRFLDAATPRNGQQSALAIDAIFLLNALGIESAIVGGCDWGARTACIMAILYPDRCRALVSVSGYLVGSQAAGAMPLAPEAEKLWWYQYYFATERGRVGYAANRVEFARLIWETASPRWSFDDADFQRSAAAFDNPDHVAITIDNYRWRIGLVPGEPRYAAYERKLAAFPPISVPTITLEGDANGAPHPAPGSYADKFQGGFEHRDIGGGIGHNLPQEAPAAFAEAIIDAGAMRRKYEGAR